MKTITSRIIPLVIWFSLSYKTCDGQYLEIIKVVGTSVNLFMKAETILAPYYNLQHKSANDTGLFNSKLDNVFSKLERIEENGAASLREMFGKLEDTPNKTVSSLIAMNLEAIVINMGEELEDIVQTARKVKNGSFVKDIYNLNKLRRSSDEIHVLKRSIVSIFREKFRSVDYLTYVKTNGSNVCTNRMSQSQALDSLRAVYVYTMIKYFISENLIISMYEKLGTPDPGNAKKTALFEEIERDFRRDLSRFQHVLLDASREFQTCTEPAIHYETGGRYVRGFWSSCYIIDRKNKYQPPKGSITSLKKVTEIFENAVCWYYFSLKPANAKPGYVVLGVKIETHLNILYIKVLQGKLLPNGLIDYETVSYNDDTEHGIDEPVVKIQWDRPLSRHKIVIDLTETVAPDDRVVTGLKFAVSKKGHVYLEVTSTKINLREGFLYSNTTRAEEHKNGLYPYAVRQSQSINDKVVRSAIGLQSVKPNQHLTLITSIGGGAHPYIDGDVIVPTPLTLLSGVSLYVKEVRGQQGFLSFRMHTFNVVPHIGISVDVNQHFTDILKGL